MTMQFLASVRRNQRQWMVVLTILSIFAFLFEDVVRGVNNLSANAIALFFAVLCAGGMSIIGYSRRHTVMYAIIGFIVGGAAALIGSTYAGPRPAVRTKFGNITREQIALLQVNRMKANRFLAIAAEKATKFSSAPNFGDTTESSMIYYSVLHSEAQRQGISVSDEGVLRFIHAATQDRLTSEDYRKSLDDVGIGEAELFDIIRGELEVMLINRLLTPPANSSPAIEQTNQFYAMLRRPQIPNRLAILTPEQQWQNFRKLNVRQALTAVAVPVSEFVKQVPEPADSELRAFFDKWKSAVADDRGNPGFLELPKVQLAYLVARDLEVYEKGLPEATDQEIADWYELHKEEFRVQAIPDSTDTMPPGTADPDAPADAAAPANATLELPAQSPDAAAVPDAAKPEKPPGDAVPEKTKPATDDKPKPPAEEPKGEKDESKDESKCDEDPAVTKDAEVDKAAGDKPAAAIELPKPAIQAAPAVQARPTPPAPALPTSDVLPPIMTLPPPTSDPHAPVRYRPLDDDLKLQIREKILLEKAFLKMSAAADGALQMMDGLNLKYLHADPAEQAKLAVEFARECKAYAEKHGLEYHETRAMTRREMDTDLEERIGIAFKGDGSQRNMQSVADAVFETTDPAGQNYRMSLYSPQRADAPDARYAFWKIAEIPARVPDLKEEVTRELVVKEWKSEKARALAEKRARELAELVKKSPGDVSATLAGQTINPADKLSPVVTIRETPKFTWMRVSQSVPSMGAQVPMESTIDGIDQPGSDFLKLVFDELGDGDVGVGLNRPRNTFYVVRVHDRDAGADDGGVGLQELQRQFLKEPFSSHMPTPYDFLGIQTQQVLESVWHQSFTRRFGIVVEDRESLEDVEQ